MFTTVHNRREILTNEDTLMDRNGRTQDVSIRVNRHVDIQMDTMRGQLGTMRGQIETLGGDIKSLRGLIVSSLLEKKH